jgi:hypothetical protein
MEKENEIEMTQQEPAVSTETKRSGVLRSTPYLDPIIKQKLRLSLSILAEEKKETRVIH